MTDEAAELLGIFLEEARECLDGTEGDFLRLEIEGAAHPELVNKAFCAVQSDRGGAGSCGVTAAAMPPHVIENTLASMQKGLSASSRDAMGVLPYAADTLAGMVHEPSIRVDCDASGQPIADLPAELVHPVGAVPPTPKKVRSAPDAAEKSVRLAPRGP